MRPVSRVSERPPLVVKTLGALRPMLERSAEDRSEGRKPQNPQESYSLTVFDRGVALVESLNVLRQVIFYVSRYPAAKTYRDRGPDRVDWLRYHIENFHIRLMGVKDRAVNLVAAVYNISPKKKSQDRPGYADVIEHPWVKGTKAAECLGRIGEETAKSKDLRDGVTHQFRYNDEELHSMELARLLADEEDEHLKHASFLFGLTSRFYVRNLAKDLTAVAENAETICLELLQILEESYLAILPNVRWAGGVHLSDSHE